MGIYIKGMEMPTKDGVYTLRIWGTGQIERLDGYHSFLLSGVKAVPVPDHGRLIDADKIGLTDFEIILCQADENRYKSALQMLLEKIEKMPTIIPADKEDG